LLIAVFDQHGAAAVGLFLLASTAPRLLGPALGALADRFDQRRIIIVTDVVQALLYLTIAAMRPPLPVLLALVTVAATAATTFTPAGRSLLPNLVGKDNLGRANAQLAVGVNIGFAAGPALGGLLLSTAGLPTTLLLDTASFIASAMLISGVHSLSSSKRTREKFAAVLHAGLSTVRRNMVVRAVSVGFLVMVTFAALDNVAIIPFARENLQASPVVIGLLGSAYGIGMILGPLLVTKIRMDLALYTAFVAIGAGTLLTGVSPIVALALAAQVLAGAGGGWHNVAADTLIQQHVPADRLGTVFGTVYMFPYAAEVLAYAAGTPLVGSLGGRAVLIISGLGVLATLALVAPMLSSALRHQPPDRLDDRHLTLLP
jgi:MFS family permease